MAQNNLEHRQTVVNVFCAYLCMPYTLPARRRGADQRGHAAAPAEDGIPAAHPVSGRDPAWEELQVRQTVQRILTAHLQLPKASSSGAAQRRRPSPRRGFWPGTSLDLTGATLTNLDFASVSVVRASFLGATFHGLSQFNEAAFHGDAVFFGATFQSDAVFGKATFQGKVSFSQVTFQGDADFNGATFQHDHAWFDEVTFRGDAVFEKATFQGDAWFSEVAFQGPAWFFWATFQGDARFDRATFQGDAWFEGATFQGKASFDRDSFQNEAKFDGAHVSNFDTPERNRLQLWPDGYTVRPDPANPTRGTLVHAEETEEPEPAVPPSDPTDHGSGSG